MFEKAVYPSPMIDEDKIYYTFIRGACFAFKPKAKNFDRYDH